MRQESEFIPISALQQYLYCPRRCALIHLEQIWKENVYTAEGRLLHEKADSGKAETRGEVKTVTGLLLRSQALGLTGKADVVEFHLQDGVWRPYPVEYKRGRPKEHDADRIQLCAQALCLEEMLSVPVPEGALFYGQTRRRQVVVLDEPLRDATRVAAQEVPALLSQGATPPPVADERCDACSLVEECLPSVGKGLSALRYLESLRDTT